VTSPVLPIAIERGSAVHAEISRLHGDGALVGHFRLEGGKRRGALGPAEGATIQRLVDAAVGAGVPVVGVLATSGADVGEGVASLHAWGCVARSLSRASGVVPIILAVVGPCVSGPALLLGMADAVVMTPETLAYVSGADAVARFTGITVSREALGGSAAHALRSGVASLLAEDEEDALHAVAEILSYLPANNATHPPYEATYDEGDRASRRAAAVVPTSAMASYDVRDVVGDIVDSHSMLELHELHAPNLVTALARIDGHPVGVVANQPNQLAGTLDIEAAQKGAAFVQWCDSFGLPLVTFVDTPGFQPGKDIEWRGMIRKGAQLVHAYAEATSPRLCVVLRKAYGGAYIVMDCKTMGSDLCVAWPQAELAVMGATGAVQILHGRRLLQLNPQAADEERAALIAEYQAQYLTPAVAAERGYIDQVIDPADTRLVLSGALGALFDKRDHSPKRRHTNGPL